MKILIVGGSGYIGSIVDKKLYRKKLFVYNLDNKIYKDQINLVKTSMLKIFSLI